MIQYMLTMHTQVAAERNLVVKQFNRCCLGSHARSHCRQLALHIHFALMLDRYLPGAREA